MFNKQRLAKQHSVPNTQCIICRSRECCCPAFWAAASKGCSQCSQNTCNLSRAKSASFLLSNRGSFAKHLHDFNILAVRSAGGEVHVLDELGMDELGIGAYALAPEFNGRAWHRLTWKTKAAEWFTIFTGRTTWGFLLTALGEPFAVLVRQHSVSPPAFALTISQQSSRKGFFTLCSSCWDQEQDQHSSHSLANHDARDRLPGVAWAWLCGGVSSGRSQGDKCLCSGTGCVYILPGQPGHSGITRETPNLWDAAELWVTGEWVSPFPLVATNLLLTHRKNFMK